MNGLPHPFRDLDITAEQAIYIARLLSASPQFYPWTVLPPDGKSFDKVGTINLPASGGGMAPSPGAETIVVSYTCPLGYNGIIRRISNNYLGPSFNPGIPSLIWRIRNGAAIEGSRFVDNYAQIVTEYGTTNFAREIDGILISSGQTVIYTVTNQDPILPAGNSQVSCCFSGSIWPEQRNSLEQGNS